MKTGLSKRRRRRRLGSSRQQVPQRQHTNSSNVVSLEPLSPIIIRSGRPLERKSDADPARFPPPSTIAGCLRTAWARTTNRAFGPDLARIAVSGPLLIRHDDQVLVPKPADAQYFGQRRSEAVLKAEPQKFEAGCGADLPDGLLPVQLTMPVSGKPASGPAWWLWSDFIAFRRGETVSYKALDENGWSPPRGDRRTHVSINPNTGASEREQLFQTEGLDLDNHLPYRDAPAGAYRLLARCEVELEETLVHLGGKRRLASLKLEYPTTWPSSDRSWWTRIIRSGGICLTLLTPSIFSAGYRPGWLDNDLVGCPPEISNLRLKLCAVAVGRWKPHSGWDLAARRPRPSQKLVDAGATYWFRIVGNAEENDVEKLWLANISDDEQARVDGFGLALPSPWELPPGTDVQ